jgi:protocatechuate 3,4-dioxygenase beta subunit
MIKLFKLVFLFNVIFIINQASAIDDASNLPASSEINHFLRNDYSITNQNYQQANITKNMPSWQDLNSNPPIINNNTIKAILNTPNSPPTPTKAILLKPNSSPRVPDQLFNPKDPTPSRIFTANLSMPTQFETSNNLAKKTGAFYRAFGEVIFLQGKIIDSFNVPIFGAIIEIWQANAAGKYHSLLEPSNEYIDKYFNMSGRAITDNLGNYYFITIMPGSYLGRAPHINMNVYHQKFGKLETEIYFESHPLNNQDYQYLAYSDKEKKLLTCIVRLSNPLDSKSVKICTFNIIMTGTHDYKSFGGPL